MRVLDDPALAQRFVEAGLIKMKGFRRDTTFPQVLEILDSAVRNG